MIECTNSKVWYKKGNRKKHKKFFRIISLLLIFSLIFIYYQRFIVKVVFDYCYDKCNGIATECVNNNIFMLSSLDTYYNNIVTIEKNNNGDITYIETNNAMINRLSSKIALSTAELVDTKLNEGIDMPLLVFSGLKLFSGYGKMVKYRALRVSNTYCDIESKFESTGINQTLHSIYLNVETTINFYMPLANREIVNTTKVLLCETVLVGKIPNIYLNRAKN